MKTRSLTNLSLAVALLGLPFAVGCAQSGATNTELALASAPPASVTSTGQNSLTVTGLAATAATTLPVPRTEPVLPPSILPDTPLAEVIKLAQSGVEESVIHTFVTNSVRPFELDAEEIVYLNDLGISGGVITAMMQHDQGLRPLPPTPAPPAPPVAPVVEATATEPVAEAPSYVEAPQAAPAVAEPQPTYVSNNYFYDSLAPYGNWVEVEGYGRCWQPTVVVINRNWQPYCDRGRWVYTDAGWYWLSDYSWGATTFHYGRWFSHPSRGWCWWPDTVWAPSWVSWRYSGAYCGWAPLPPAACYQPGFGFSFNGSAVSFGFGFGLGASAYTFVPWGNFCAARPYQYRVPPHHAGQVYNNSTVINNYVNGNNNTVINRGISPDRVREHTGTEVRTVRLRDASPGMRSTRRGEQLDRDGRTLLVHRPTLSPLAGGGATSDRSVPRTSSPGVSEATIARTPRTSANVPVTRNGRGEFGITRSRANENTAVPAVVPSPGETKAPSPSPGRVETVSTRGPQPRSVVGNSNPVRANSPEVVRPPEVAPVPATAPVLRSTSTQPRINQSAPQNAARPAPAAPSSSLVVIGGKSSSRSSGRDYSVYSTPAPTPSVSAPASPPRAIVPSQRAPAPVVTSPRAAETTPAPAASRGSYSSYATPARTTPTTPSYNARPAPPSPALNSARFEPRPAPVAPTTAPARPPSAPASSPAPRSR